MLLGRFDMRGLLVPQSSSHMSPCLPCLAVRLGIGCFLSMMTRRKRNKNKRKKRREFEKGKKKLNSFHFLHKGIQDLWTWERLWRGLEGGVNESGALSFRFFWSQVDISLLIPGNYHRYCQSCWHFWGQDVLFL